MEEETESLSSAEPQRRCLNRSQRPNSMALLVVLLGFAATAAFLGLGITSARSTAEDDFQQTAVILIQQIENAWADYEVAALWTHQACTSHKDFHHQEFRELYEQLVSTGIDVQIEFLPNVTHEDREYYESLTRQYYSQIRPDINYQGFVGLEPLNDGSGDYDLLPRSDQDFYFPIHFIEPIEGSEAAIDLDVYSRPRAKFTIDKALETWKPALSDPARLVEETVDNAFAVFFFHPGTPLSTQPGLRPTDLSLLVIRIPDLVLRAKKGSTHATSVFLVDTTNSDKEQFLGGVELSLPNGETCDDGLCMKLFPPTSLSEIRETNKLKKETATQIADREWTIVVVAVDGTYTPEVTYVVIGGVLLFVCSVCIAAWVFSSIQYSNMRKEAKLREVQNFSRAEKALLVLENAKQTAIAERDLNDYLSHEVRNPLSAALSACIFLGTAVEPKKVESEAGRSELGEDGELEPLVLDSQTQNTIREDVNVISSSLRFINELLRSMLDIHRANNDQLVLDPTPTDMKTDLFEPVKSMCYSRDHNFNIEIECPDDCVVMVDRLRLQQVVLNLSRNSIKFVDQGFIRLRAWEHSDGYICLAIEDSGPGIPMEKREHLFNRFQSSLDSLAQGTGVGLNLCKSLVEAMEGEIYLDNSYYSGVEGCPGARFVIALRATPVLSRNSSNDDNHQSFTSIATEEPSSYHGLPEHLSVLFVDDERILRKLAIRAIGKLRPNWTVREAATGEAALARIETESFDLIFMDMYFTSTERQLTGIETVRAMRAKGVTCCICGLSANNLEGQFQNAGASSFLTKPFPAKQDDLRPFLENLLHPSNR